MKFSETFFPTSKIAVTLTFDTESFWLIHESGTKVLAPIAILRSAKSTDEGTYSNTTVNLIWFSVRVLTFREKKDRLLNSEPLEYTHEPQAS